MSKGFLEVQVNFVNSTINSLTFWEVSGLILIFLKAEGLCKYFQMDAVKKGLFTYLVEYEDS